MVGPQQNIPNTQQKTVEAYMRVRSFISPENPTPEQITKFDQEIVEFLETIDNVKRFLNGRNSYSVGSRLYVLVWFLEKIPDQPVTQPFGGAAAEVTTEKKDEQNPSTPQTENK
jgi:F0F1-type ATP synthase beta subunit